jgi:hypothetical protein
MKRGPWIIVIVVLAIVAGSGAFAFKRYEAWKIALYSFRDQVLTPIGLADLEDKLPELHGFRAQYVRFPHLSYAF